MKRSRLLYGMTAIICSVLFAGTAQADRAYIQYLQPNTAVAHGSGFELRVIGTGFQPGDEIIFETGGDNTLPTTYISPEELRGGVAASLIQYPGTFPVFVISGQYHSNQVPFTVTPSSETWPVNMFILNNAGVQPNVVKVDAGSVHQSYQNVGQVLQTTIPLPPACIMVNFRVYAPGSGAQSTQAFTCSTLASSEDVEVDMEINRDRYTGRLSCAAQTLAYNGACQGR